MNPNAVRENNFLVNGQITHYNHLISNFTAKDCWDEVLERSEYTEKLNEIEEFNKCVYINLYILQILNTFDWYIRGNRGCRSHRWKKRGIGTVPTMYGIGFDGKASYLNQAGALVLVYIDGSVLLAHGGVEMGQGLHTKMIQVASNGLNIPAELIHIKETSTDKVANASSTSGSFNSDLYGMAVLVSMFLSRDPKVFEI